MKFSYLGLCIASLAACSDTAVEPRPPGATVYDASVRKLQLEKRGGGLAGDPRPDVVCSSNVAKYTLTTAGHQLAWDYCQEITTGDTTTRTRKAGARALEDAEWAALEPKLSTLVVSGATDCGADKVEQAVVVTTGLGDVEYGDDFYACRDRTKPYIVGDALDAVLGALRALADQ